MAERQLPRELRAPACTASRARHAGSRAPHAFQRQGAHLGPEVPSDLAGSSFAAAGPTRRGPCERGGGSGGSGADGRSYCKSCSCKENFLIRREWMEKRKHTVAVRAQMLCM
ncbi:hypothetical protein AV530_006440 [Patagioenas fasciata monilis]|uniref:Uncharacterized protein n=1 Tax=Patagioenas fasciata monilis TaxID=372326 RepID=A0A1V4KGI8_PATFA|nr:hypothetical protein AV530_006440 [Patagioenas fasciata monilis]